VSRRSFRMADPVASRADVARLFGRAAFGASAAQLDQWQGKPYSSVVDHLLTIPDPATRNPATDDVTRQVAEVGHNLQLAQSWWMGRMQTTPWPLEERMVLFWHDHWATSIGSEAATVMLLMRQNQTLRLHALGSFRTMCEELTLDPAMLIWLSGSVNTLERPNENYAREFFELFTLGTIPQVYGEHDIRESARALTGWNADMTGLKRFYAAKHDTGTKTVLGRTITDAGDLEYKAIVDAALSQPVAPKFVAYKLVQSFAYVPTTRDLFADPDPLVDVVANALAGSGWSIRQAVRALLLSDHFRYADPSLERQVVRQPAELVVHGAKAAGIAADDPALPKVIAAAGQSLFEPPNVGGWPVGRGWLSTTTAIARYGIPVALAKIRTQTLEALRPVLPPSSDVASGANAWARHMGLAALHPTTLAALKSYVSVRKGQAGATEIELQDGILSLLMSSPDWEVM
jgi:uncharacterized protein (DUF1800 family)